MDELKVRKLRTLMAALDLDAVVGISKENVAYLSSWVVRSQRLDLNQGDLAVILTRDGTAAFLVPIGELSAAQDQSAIRGLHPYDDLATAPMGALADLLCDLGLGTGRIGLDLEGLSAVRWADLKWRMTGAEFTRASDLFLHARMTKTPAEIERLRSASEIAELALVTAHAGIGPGMRQRDIRRAVVNAVLASGAESIVSINVSDGSPGGSALRLGDRVLSAGEMVKIDLSVSVDGYWASTSRVVKVGNPDSSQEEISARLQETMRVIHNSVRAGVTVISIWEAFVKEFGRNDRAPAYRYLGHGLGLGLLEEPFVWSGARGTLDAGMVLSIAPVFHDGDAGYHMEDTLLVTTDGVENLTARFASELITSI